MSSINKIIFVCTGNTCRSPMAEKIYQRYKIDKIQAVSRGLVVLFSEPANPNACMVVKENGMSLEDHQAMQFVAEEVDAHTLILTMTQKQKDSILNSYGIEQNLYCITEFVGQTGDVEDPYGGELADYEECYQEILQLVKQVIKRIKKEA